jgi:hypothetical protein
LVSVTDPYGRILFFLAAGFRSKRTAEGSLRDWNGARKSPGLASAEEGVPAGIFFNLLP